MRRRRSWRNPVSPSFSPLPEKPEETGRQNTKDAIRFKPFSDLDGSSSSFSEFGLLGCRGYLNVTDSTSKAQRAGCLLKKIMQIIELRVSHQAESIKNGIEMHEFCC
ncbi:hypothetical protein S83_069312 [Arachis hypogaea]